MNRPAMAPLSLLNAVNDKDKFFVEVLRSTAHWTDEYVNTRTNIYIYACTHARIYAHTSACAIFCTRPKTKVMVGVTGDSRSILSLLILITSFTSVTQGCYLLALGSYRTLTEQRDMPDRVILQSFRIRPTLPLHPKGSGPLGSFLSLQPR